MAANALPQLLNLWAHLHAAHRLYWTLHWQARGPAFYADHELFGRLYGARPAEIDSLAEMIASTYGSEHLDATKSLAAEQTVMAALVKQALPSSVPAAVLKAAEEANEAVASCVFPAAMQNLVSGIGTNHLSDLYLLRQREKSW